MYLHVHVNEIFMTNLKVDVNMSFENLLNRKNGACIIQVESIKCIK